ncbi:MAG: hypothetical protein KC912_20740 [Proteobacteria bacterium]|nr:hypothetical protein [Pseudomonadota bacterium]
MIQDDWILRVIEQFAQAIAARLRGGAADEALVAEARSRTALNSEQVAGMPWGGLMGLLGTPPDAKQALTLGLLLVEDGLNPVRAKRLIELAVAHEPKLATEAVAEILRGL